MNIQKIKKPLIVTTLSEMIREKSNAEFKIYFDKDDEGYEYVNVYSEAIDNELNDFLLSMEFYEVFYPATECSEQKYICCKEEAGKIVLKYLKENRTKKIENLKNEL